MKAIGRIIQVLIWIALGLAPASACTLMASHSTWDGVLSNISAVVMGIVSGILIFWYAPEQAKQFYNWYKRNLKQGI